MFSSNSSTPSQNPHTAAPSIISSDVVITGLLQSEGDLQIDGRVEGNVRAVSLVIGSSAQICGEIEAEHVIVRGRVEGTIRARKIAIAEGSHVEGDILHGALEVEFGAFIQGTFRHSADPLALQLPVQTVDETEKESPMVERRRAGSPLRQVTPQEAAMDENEEDLRAAG